MVIKYGEHFKRIFNLTRHFSSICGVDVVDNNYKPCWRTFAVLFLINFSIGFTFYTNYLEVIIKGNLNNLLATVAIIGTGLQGYCKLLNGLNQQTNFRCLHQEILEMYETYELSLLPYRNCLKNSVNLVKRLLATLLTFLVLTLGFIIGIPIYIKIFYNTHVELLPFKLPYLDFETEFGYFITTSIHIIAVLFGGFGNFISDSWLYMFAAHIPLIKNLLKCKIDDFDEMLDMQTRDTEKLQKTLKDIFQWHQKYINFCSVIRDTFFWVIFVQVSTEFFGIISTIVCMFLGIWPPAPAYLLYLLAMFYSYCSLGNVVEVSNDDVISIIYDSCWYKLTVPEQKMILIMLRQSQQAESISVGGVAPLSLSTALQVTKTVYTLSMMLMEFLNK